MSVESGYFLAKHFFGVFEILTNYSTYWNSAPQHSDNTFLMFIRLDFEFRFWQHLHSFLGQLPRGRVLGSYRCQLPLPAGCRQPRDCHAAKVKALGCFHPYSSSKNDNTTTHVKIKRPRSRYSTAAFTNVDFDYAGNTGDVQHLI